MFHLFLFLPVICSLSDSRNVSQITKISDIGVKFGFVSYISVVYINIVFIRQRRNIHQE